MDERCFSVRIPADARYLRSVRLFFNGILEEIFGSEEAERLNLALGEACANVVCHRHHELRGNSLHIEAMIGEERCRFRLGHFCRKSDVVKIKPRELTDVRPGGLGTHFINQIMDHVDFEPETDTADCMALVLTKTIPGVKAEHGPQRD